MNIPRFTLILICLFFVTSSVAVEAQTSGVLFTVNNNADSVDATPGDRICADSLGQCTLRAAIQEANSNPAGYDVIIFAMPWPAVINLTLGSLTIAGTNKSIVGPGARRLSIQPGPGLGPFRLFAISGSNITIRGLSIKNANSGELLSGAAISTGDGTVQLTEVALLNNASGDNGGAIANNGNLTITRSLIAGNSCLRSGGAIYNAAGSNARITNSTITVNHTSGNGGAIWNAGSLLLVNNTISHNSAFASTHSIFSDPAGSINVLNTIIGSDVGSTLVTSLSGAFTSLGNNIVTDARTSTGFTNGVNSDQVSDGNIINPLLGNLADNGGQTDTRALLTGSTAINTGNSCVWNGNCVLPSGPPLRLFWDQRRGYLRGGIFDAVDIGAYEVSNGSSSGGSAFGLFPQNPPGRYLNSIAVFTNVSTNEKTYRVINLLGGFRSPQLGNEVHVLEYRTKRAPGLPPTILAFPD
jgi:CSLREA domain-containing protein